MFGFFYLRGQGSDSEGEELGGDGDVILPQDLPGRGNVHSQQSVIRLSEVNCCLKVQVNLKNSIFIQLGPRLTLQLVKVEAGLCEGEVLHHAFSKFLKQFSLPLSLSLIHISFILQFIKVRKSRKL